MNINAPLLESRHGFRARVPLNAINSLVLIVFSIALTLIGCSGGGSSTSSSPIFPIDTHNPISKVAQSGSVLTAENRIPIYSRVGQRVGLLDPLNATEIWSRSAPDFEFGIALHVSPQVSRAQAQESRLTRVTCLLPQRGLSQLMSSRLWTGRA